MRKAGIRVHDLEFPDGTCPDFGIIERFIKIVEETKRMSEAVAVHCRAGLGRTGTLIGCYIINKFKSFKDAKSVIGWLRIVRPGSVIGIQQQFLVDNFEKLQCMAVKSDAPK